MWGWIPRYNSSRWRIDINYTPIVDDLPIDDLPIIIIGISPKSYSSKLYAIIFLLTLFTWYLLLTLFSQLHFLQSSSLINTLFSLYNLDNFICYFYFFNYLFIWSSRDFPVCHLTAYPPNLKCPSCFIPTFTLPHPSNIFCLFYQFLCTVDQHTSNIVSISSSFFYVK